MTSTGPNSIAAIVVAAGAGARAGLGYPKQFALLRGKPMLRWSVEALVDHPAITQVVVVIGDRQDSIVRSVLHGLEVDQVTGGATRRSSVAAGLARLTPDIHQHVLVHDAARPFLNASIIDRLIIELGEHDGAIPVLPITDTLVTAAGTFAGDTVDRAMLRRVQTPQAFRLPALIAAHSAWTGNEPTDDAQMVRRAGGKIALIEGDSALEKFTYFSDFGSAFSTASLQASRWRTAVGLGYDVHRLVLGAPLWLGGVNIPHSHGLEGHSDADVALHALTDAILGALGDGDIGTFFPPTDPQWRGAKSDRFLAFASDRVMARGGRIDHLDLTIICEAPKIGPYRDAIRARVAHICNITESQVSIKATTTEKLGFTGRREGIAAQAAATLALPLMED